MFAFWDIFFVVPCFSATFQRHLFLLHKVLEAELSNKSFATEVTDIMLQISV